MEDRGKDFLSNGLKYIMYKIENDLVQTDKLISFYDCYNCNLTFADHHIYLWRDVESWRL